MLAAYQQDPGAFASGMLSGGMWDDDEEMYDEDEDIFYEDGCYGAGYYGSVSDQEEDVFGDQY